MEWSVKRLHSQAGRNCVRPQLFFFELVGRYWRAEMRPYSRQRCVLVLTMQFLCAAVALAGEIPGTAFTYQGQLKQNGTPANSTCDMVFAVFDADVTPLGNEVADPIIFGAEEAIQVVNGLFTVELSFDGDVFDGQARWLEVAVRCPSWDEKSKEPEFTRLEPRNLITPAPYALYALAGPGGPTAWAAEGLNIHNTNAGNVGIGTIAPIATLDVVNADVSERAIHGSSPGVGVLGTHTAANGTFPGVWGETDSLSTGASGVRGIVNSTTPGPNSAGIYGINNGAGSDGAGVRGIHNGSGVGVQGEVTAGNAFSGKFVGGRGARVQTNLSGGVNLDLKGTANSGLNFTLGTMNFVDGADTIHGGVTYRRTLLGDRLGFIAGQQEQVVIDQAGRVGIGVVSPTAKLDVNGTVNTASIVVDGTTTTDSVEVDGGSIRVLGAGESTPTAVFIQVVTVANGRSCDNAGRFCNGTTINHPMSNNDPNAMIFVSLRDPDSEFFAITQFSSRDPMMVRYDSKLGRWYISGFVFHTGTRFNVMIIKS